LSTLMQSCSSLLLCLRLREECMYFKVTDHHFWQVRLQV